MNELDELDISIENFIKFYTQLRLFLLELQRLNNEDVNRLFEKYEVVIDKRRINAREV